MRNCSHNSGKLYSGMNQRWECINCGHPFEQDEKKLFAEFESLISSLPEVACECGADKAYGPSKATHSHYCPKWTK